MNTKNIGTCEMCGNEDTLSQGVCVSCINREGYLASL